jgi:hygromycin-B 7''-O-kinase
VLPPPVRSQADLRACVGDAAVWQPFVDEVLARHGRTDEPPGLRAGTNPTYPTFLRGDVVVKLFGGPDLPWRRTFAAERVGLEFAGTEPGLRAPELLAAGELFPGEDEPWPYLVTQVVPGRPLWAADLDPNQRVSLAGGLGLLLRRLQALPASPALPTDGEWRDLDVAAAVGHSSLPDHLVRGVRAFVAEHPLRGRVVVHGDVITNHVYVDSRGQVTGLIDWGDVAVTDPHYELAQVHGDIFECDIDLLRVLLEAADWPVEPDFAQRALAAALWRQAVGWSQHHSMDVFDSVGGRLPLADIATLDELAVALFGV